ncbi:hypothetical protein T484DRAFT_1775516 [Baffinella frigidus]|nr:hypothetical protein T484DRAFT_1775516 [Cryptophyta sp. CCMP2293]
MKFTQDMSAHTVAGNLEAQKLAVLRAFNSTIQNVKLQRADNFAVLAGEGAEAAKLGRSIEASEKARSPERDASGFPANTGSDQDGSDNEAEKPLTRREARDSAEKLVERLAGESNQRSGDGADAGDQEEVESPEEQRLVSQTTNYFTEEMDKEEVESPEEQEAEASAERRVRQRARDQVTLNPDP